MFQWILVLIFSTTSGSVDTEYVNPPFATQASCEAAGAKVHQSTMINHDVRFSFVCLKH